MFIVSAIIGIVALILVYSKSNWKRYANLTDAKLREIAVKVPVELDPLAKFGCLIRDNPRDCKKLVGVCLSKALGYHYRPTEDIVSKLHHTLSRFDRARILSALPSVEDTDSDSLVRVSGFEANEVPKLLQHLIDNPDLPRDSDLHKEVVSALPLDAFTTTAVYKDSIAERLEFWAYYFKAATKDAQPANFLTDMMLTAGGASVITRYCKDSVHSSMLHRPHPGSLYAACRGDDGALADFIMLESGKPLRTKTEVEDAVIEYLSKQLTLPGWIEGLGELDENGDYVKELIVIAARRAFILEGSRHEYDYLIEGITRISAAIGNLSLIEASRPDLLTIAESIIINYEFESEKPLEPNPEVAGWEPIFHVYGNLLFSTNMYYAEDDPMHEPILDLKGRIEIFFKLMMDAGVATDEGRARDLIAALQYLLQAVHVFDDLLGSN